MKRIFQIVGMVIALTLAGCSSTQPTYAPPAKFEIEDREYYRISRPVQCVPYARDISGIQIRGDAHTWWAQAEGNYRRGKVPRPGAVMVLARTQRLTHGHVAVVKKVINNRLIEVAHSNWGNDRDTRCVVYERMKVSDSSPNNDWSSARFWNYPSKTFGSPYKVSGFIYPN